jgi:hypothetical protein
MRILMTSVVVALFSAASLLATDLTITQVGTGRGQEGEQVQLWSSRFMRINHPAGQTDSMVDFTQGVSYTINHKKKLIQKMSWDDLEAALEASAEKMKSLPAFALKLMGGGDGQVTVEDLGSETLLGRTCHRWRITMGKLVLESSNDPSLKPPIPVNAYKRFLRLRNAIGQMGPSATSMLKLGEELAKVQGVALKTRTVMPLVGEVTTTATAIKEGPIPSSAFDLPSDYKVEDAGKRMRESLTKDH